MRTWRGDAARLLTSENPILRSLVGSLLLGLVLLLLAIAGLVLVNATFTTIFLTYVVAVVGLGAFMGNSGVLSFGHAGFMAVAAYVSGILSMDPNIRYTILLGFPESWSSLNPPFALGAVIALVVVAIFALAFGLVVCRLPMYAAGIATLGLLVIVQTTLLAADELTSGASPLYGVAREVDWPTALVVAVVAIVVARIFRESRAGLQLRSSREDELAAQAAGVNIRARRLQAWVLSAVITGTGGILFGHALGAFAPNQFYLTLTVALVAMLILGGATTVSGAVVGTALVTIPLEVLSRVESGANVGLFKLPAIIGLPTLGVSVVFIITVYFRREGLMGRYELDELMAKWLLRAGRQEHLHTPTPAGGDGPPPIRSVDHAASETPGT